MATSPVTARRFMANLPAMDAAGIPALQDAIRHLHGLEAIWLESAPVHEQQEGEGEVQVFAVEHPKATRVYAWSHETEGAKRRFHAVLGAKLVDGAVTAVRSGDCGEPEKRQQLGLIVDSGPLRHSSPSGIRYGSTVDRWRIGRN